MDSLLNVITVLMVKIQEQVSCVNECLKNYAFLFSAILVVVDGYLTNFQYKEISLNLISLKVNF